MNFGSALREGVSFFVAHERGTFLLCLKTFLACVAGSAILVMAQNGLIGGPQRRRVNLAFGAFDREWRLLALALIRLRLGVALRRLRDAVTEWFRWKDHSQIGRFDSILIAAIAMIGGWFVVIDLAVAVFRMLRIIWTKS